MLSSINLFGRGSCAHSPRNRRTKSGSVIFEVEIEVSNFAEMEEQVHVD